MSVRRHPMGLPGPNGGRRSAQPMCPMRLLAAFSAQLVGRAFSTALAARSAARRNSRLQRTGMSALQKRRRPRPASRGRGSSGGRTSRHSGLGRCRCRCRCRHPEAFRSAGLGSSSPKPSAVGHRHQRVSTVPGPAHWTHRVAVRTASSRSRGMGPAAVLARAGKASVEPLESQRGPALDLVGVPSGAARRATAAHGEPPVGALEPLHQRSPTGLHPALVHLIHLGRAPSLERAGDPFAGPDCREHHRLGRDHPVRLPRSRRWGDPRNRRERREAPLGCAVTRTWRDLP